MFNWGLPAGHPSTRPPEAATLANNTNTGDGARADESRVCVNMLIAMPQQRRLEDKGEVEDLDIVLGVAEVPYPESTSADSDLQRKTGEDSSPAG